MILLHILFWECRYGITGTHSAAEEENLPDER